MYSLTALNCEPTDQTLTAFVYIVLEDLDLWSV